MPVWIEILINVAGYAGFIGLASFHGSSSETSTDP
jgi:hypothetical protein